MLRTTDSPVLANGPLKPSPKAKWMGGKETWVFVDEGLWAKAGQAHRAAKDKKKARRVAKSI
jgi:hypothetical protein